VVYYNDNDPVCVAWLHNLIAAGALPPGVVDPRDLRDVRGSDLVGFTHCHFFAGIGGWALAIALAGWPADAEVWTGSCPCQPFSKIGKSKGVEDARHLWPTWRDLIAERRPAIVFGEQVDRGVQWLATVRDDLEHQGYAVAAASLPAAYCGAPHRRQRLWFVGESERARLEGFPGHGDDAPGREEPRRSTGAAGATGAPWSRCDWLPCADGRHRPVEPGTFPLADGIPARVGRLRAYGNAIVPQVGAAFVRAYREAARSLRTPTVCVYMVTATLRLVCS
jgi:DNA (cytosine-5)-methyltransferase 1